MQDMQDKEKEPVKIFEYFEPQFFPSMIFVQTFLKEIRNALEHNMNNNYVLTAAQNIR